MLRNYHKEHQALDQGSHSTEENLLTIQDLRNLFVDDETVEFQRIQEEQSNLSRTPDNCIEETADELAASPRDSEATRDEVNENVLASNNLPAESNQDANEYDSTPHNSLNDDTYVEEPEHSHSVTEMIQESVISEILDRVNMSIE